MLCLLRKWLRAVWAAPTMVQAGHHAQKFVCYPISRAHAERGEALINWICDLHMGDKAMLPREDWNRPGKLADFLPQI